MCQHHDSEDTMRRLATTLVGLLLAAAVVAPVSGQTAVTTADLDRLTTSLSEAESAITGLRSRDTARARQMTTDLDALREDVTYLKVKLRREGSVTREEYADVRDRISNLTARARGEATGPSTPTPTAQVNSTNDVPAGTELDVRLQSTLDSETAQVEDRFEATTVVDVRNETRVLIPAGSVMRGIVSSVEKAGRLDRSASLTLSFDQITVNGRAYPIRATVTSALKAGGYKEDAAKIGVGAAIGAILGGIIGGGTGALTGILVGGGGVVAATEGQDVELPVGTVLRTRLDTTLTVR
jgi:hypothetical protein